MTVGAYQDEVLWRDTDASGVIHYASVFAHVERAEVAFFRDIGLRWDHLLSRFTMPRVHVEANYLRPLRFPTPITVAVRVERVGTASLGLGFDLLDAGALAVEVRVTMVCVQPGATHTTPWPDDVRRVFEAHLAGPGAGAP